jgi:hypothetical protein
MTTTILRYFDLETCASIDPQRRAFVHLAVTQDDQDEAQRRMQAEVDCLAEEIAIKRWRANQEDRP